MNHCRIVWMWLLLWCMTPAAMASQWYEYSSENFSVFSDADQDRVRDLMRDLERFRAAALSFTGLDERPENRRLRVYLFKYSEEFQRFSGDQKIAGFYRETWHGPVIFARSSGHGISGSGLIFHEYVHHLMRERSALTYPRWYGEGFAELLASAELRRDTVVIGGVPEWRLGAWIEEGARPLTIVELLQPDLGNQNAAYWNNYYASAWLFTHFLQLGANSGERDLREATNNYLNAIATGEDPLTEFKTYFGNTTAEMQHALERYVQSDLYGFRFDVPEYRYAISRRALPENERLLQLAENAQAFGDLGLAQQYLGNGETYAPGWLELQLSLALIKSDQGERKFGVKIVQEIEAQGLPTHFAAAKLSLWYLQQLRGVVARGNWDEESYRAAIKYGQLAVQQDATYLPGYRNLWGAYQLKGDTAKALQVMLSAYQEASEHLGLNSEIGFYLAGIGKPEQARPFLERVLAWSHSAELRARAEHILKQPR